MKHTYRVLKIMSSVFLCASLVGCRNVDVSSTLVPASKPLESSSSASTGIQSAAMTSSVKSKPDLTREPQRWDFFIPEDYKPYVDASSGLYSSFLPSQDIPYRDINVLAFDGRKVVLEYAYDHYGGEGGGPPLKPGKIVIYDLETGEYTSAGERLPGYVYNNSIIMGSYCYYARGELSSETDDPLTMEKIDLSTGKRVSAASGNVENSYMRGYTLKVDGTHFILSLDKENTLLYDTESDSFEALPKPFPEELDGHLSVSFWKGKVYWILRQIVSRHPKVFRYYAASYDLDSGELRESREVKETLYFLPGQPFAEYIKADEEVTFHSNDYNGGEIYWLAWGKDGSVRQFRLAHPEISAFICDNMTHQAQSTGTVYFWDKVEHLLFLMDVETSETRVLDIGYREPWHYSITIFPDEEGDILVYFNLSETFYVLPKATVEKYAVEIEKYF